MFQGPATITQEREGLVARFKLVGSDVEIPYNRQALAELKKNLQESVNNRDGNGDPDDPAKLGSDKLSLRNIEIALEEMEKAAPDTPSL